MTDKNKRPRKLTERDKKERAKIREQLRAEGLLPPTKKALNHKKFIEAAEKLYKTEDLLDMVPYIYWALAEMMRHGGGRLDKEAVGAAKVLLLAKQRKEFEESQRKPGQSLTYTVGELYEAVEEIYNA